MLGGSNPVGSSNPAGIGSSLNYVGKHAYATSGQIDTDSSAKAYLDFTTASNTYIVGEFFAVADAVSGNDQSVSIEYDGQIVFDQRYTDTNPPGGVMSITTMLLPPETRIRLLIQNHSGGNIPMTAGFTGEVYA